MAELTHDTAEDGFHEIQLSGKQLVFLFMTATIVSVFIFLCGVLVGRGVRDARGGGPDPVATAAQVQQQDTASPEQKPAEPPVPAESADAPAKPDTFTYPDRLQGAETPREGLKKPAPAVEAAPPATQAAAPAPQRTGPAIDVPTSGRPGALVVQVFASQDAAAASALVKRLGAKGYPAFLSVPSSASAPRTYRVQVGRFNDRREAEDVKRRLEKEEQFKPWITSSR